MNGCKDCRYKRDEEIPQEERVFGVEKVSYCKKYKDIILKFHFDRSLLPKLEQQIIETSGVLCEYFKKMIL